MIKLPEELKNLTENDKIIYHFDGDFDFAEFLVILSQLPNGIYIKNNWDTFSLKNINKKRKSIRVCSRCTIACAPKSHYAESQYRYYQQFTIKKEKDNE